MQGGGSGVGGRIVAWAGEGDVVARAARRTRIGARCGGEGVPETKMGWDELRWAGTIRDGTRWDEMGMGRAEME
jgi:hypothetical protein